MFQDVIKPYVVYPGKNNTFGVTEGIDGEVYAALGYNFTFDIDPVLSNPLNFTQKPLAYGFSTMPVKTNKGTMAWAEDVYIGHDDIMVNRFNGLFDNKGAWNRNANLPTNVTRVVGRKDCTTVLTNPQQAMKIFQS